MLNEFIIESNDSILISIANSIENIDIVMAHTPNAMSEKQVGNYLKVRHLLAKARTIIEDADDIAHCLWSD